VPSSPTRDELNALDSSIGSEYHPHCVGSSLIGFEELGRGVGGKEWALKEGADEEE
jgi:hypothetical protein